MKGFFERRRGREDERTRGTKLLIMNTIRTHKDLVVYQMAFESAIEIFEITKSFPMEERYSMTKQIRKSSRSVCANISEAFRRRVYPKSFLARLTDSISEASETQTWLDFALEYEYIDLEKYDNLYKNYDNIIGKLINMSRKPEKWSFNH
jgi:four helix bundle protein